MNEQLFQAALLAQSKAYAPYSQFQVGAAILDNNGKIHAGANVENSAYPLGVCAEQSAISIMMQNNGQTINKILIVNSGEKISSPCGGCRQRILEFSDSNTSVLLCENQQIVQQLSIAELLPFGFDKSYLIP